MKTVINTLVCTSSLICFSVLAANGQTAIVDNKGCWNAKHATGGECLVVTHKKPLSNNGISIVYKNTCSARIYARMCNFKNAAYNDCGVSGISAGSTHTSTTHSKATGQYTYLAVGSVKSSNDWVCAERVAGKAWYNLGK